MCALFYSNILSFLCTVCESGLVAFFSFDLFFIKRYFKLVLCGRCHFYTFFSSGSVKITFEAKPLSQLNSRYFFNTVITDISISYFTTKDLCLWHYNNCFTILTIAGIEELEKHNFCWERGGIHKLRHCFAGRQGLLGKPEVQRENLDPKRWCDSIWPEKFQTSERAGKLDVFIQVCTRSSPLFKTQTLHVQQSALVAKQ